MTGWIGGRHNLPVTLSDFIGRRPEIAQLHAACAQRRLVTLVGPAGTGKTRLAVEAGRRLTGGWPDTVWFAELMGVRDAPGVAAELARVLAVHEESGTDVLDSACRRLEATESLVILDNCDHVVSECADVAAHLIAACPAVRVWATSREPLGIDGEGIVEVTPLRVPPDSVASAGEALRYEAVAMFAAVASQCVPGFAVDADNFRDVCLVCRRLDGLPLAVELAAARIPVLTPAQILARLDDRFRLLTINQRGRLSPFLTLRSALAWSHDLLDERSRTLLRQLAGFADTASLEALTFAGAWDEAEALDLLQGLVRKSLVTVERRTSEARYGLLESVRAYVLEAPIDADRLADLDRRRFAWYVQRARRAHDAMRGPTQAQEVDAIRSEHKNLLACLEQAAAYGDQATIRQLAAWLWLPWFRAGRWGDALSWIDRALASDPRDDAPILMELLLGRGYVATFHGTYDEAREALDACIHLATATGDLEWQALALVHAGVMEGRHGDFERARVMFENALALARQASIPILMERFIGNLASVAMRTGDVQGAGLLFDEALAMCRARGDRSSELIVLNNVVQLAVDAGDLDRAEKLLDDIRALGGMDADRYMELRVHTTAMLVASQRGSWLDVWSMGRQAIELAVEIGDYESVAVGLEGCAMAVASTDVRAGARLLGAAATLRDRYRVPLPTNEHAAMVRSAPVLFQALGDDADVGAAHREGGALGEREAIALASTLPAPGEAQAPEHVRTVRLEQARLCREGDYWSLSFRGRVSRIRHVVGLEHLAVLLAHPGTEVHALALQKCVDPAHVSGAGARSSLALLDDQAKREYRGRLHDLRREIDDAETTGDTERLARSKAEQDVLVRELARAVGLGGRDRPGGSDAERARVRVTKALRGAVASVARIDADLGRHLQAGLRTGSFCSYNPGLAEPLSWDVHG